MIDLHVTGRLRISVSAFCLDSSRTLRGRRGCGASVAPALFGREATLAFPAVAAAAALKALWQTLRAEREPISLVVLDLPRGESRTPFVRVFDARADPLLAGGELLLLKAMRLVVHRGAAILCEASRIDSLFLRSPGMRPTLRRPHSRI